MKKRFSFTITALRSKEDIASYRRLLIADYFQGIEIFYPYQLDENGQNTYYNAIKDLIKDLDIEVVLHLPHGGDSNDLVNNKEAIQRFYDAIDFGKKFNVNKYTLHLGSTKEHSQEEYLNISADNVKRLAEYAKPANIMIENMPSNIEVGAIAYEIKYVIEKVNMPNVKLIYDTGHGHVSLKDTDAEIEFLSELRPYLYHMHISDNDSSRDMHARIGVGNIEFKKLFSSIEDYNELYCLEILYKDDKDLENYYFDLMNVLN